MSDIDFSSYDFSNAGARQECLKSIPPDRATAKRFHRELLDIFRHEIDSRKNETSGDEEGDLFENLYWCALLLYLVGDPADVSLIWEAKQINMDTASGLDGQFLVGAGVERTLEHLRNTEKSDIADYIQELKHLGEFDDLGGWEKFRIHYFYGGL